MGFFKKLLVLIGPRLVAAVTGIVAGKLAEKGITVDPATITGIALGTYATVHKVISSKVNPGDAASGRIATAEKKASDNGSSVVVAPPTL